MIRCIVGSLLLAAACLGSGCVASNSQPQAVETMVFRYRLDDQERAAELERLQAEEGWRAIDIEIATLTEDRLLPFTEDDALALRHGAIVERKYEKVEVQEVLVILERRKSSSRGTP